MLLSKLSDSVLENPMRCEWSVDDEVIVLPLQYNGPNSVYWSIEESGSNQFN